jgi:hypothetical protein
MLFTKGIRQIRHNVRFKKYCTNFDVGRRFRHIPANETLAPLSLVPQIMRSCAKNIFSHSFRKYMYFFTIEDELMKGRITMLKSIINVLITFNLNFELMSSGVPLLMNYEGSKDRKSIVKTDYYRRFRNFF